jgi:hypothetical protein
LSQDGSHGPSPSPAAGRTRGDGPADPYRDWLNVATIERPPSHYALLGLPELEDDRRAIQEAARRAKKTVRAYQIGAYRDQAVALLAEIARAVDTLTDADKKAEYDAERRAQLLALAQENFPQAELRRPLEDVFADWLGQSLKAGVPVPQLLPDLMQWCLGRALVWPTRGAHGVPLPLGLWIYAEAAIVGQCVRRSGEAQRAAAVKRLQQAFGISEQLSRIVILSVHRRPRSFVRMDLVRKAAEQPAGLMQDWVDRLALWRITLEATSPAYASLAFLLGLADPSGRPVAEPVRPKGTTVKRDSAVRAGLRRAGELPGRVAAAICAREHLASALKVAVPIAGAVLLLIVILLWVLGRGS